MEEQGCLMARGPGAVSDVSPVVWEKRIALEHPDILDYFVSRRAANRIENRDLVVTCFTFIYDPT